MLLKTLARPSDGCICRGKGWDFYIDGGGRVRLERCAVCAAFSSDAAAAEAALPLLEQLAGGVRAGDARVTEAAIDPDRCRPCKGTGEVVRKCGDFEIAETCRDCGGFGRVFRAAGDAQWVFRN